MFLLFFINQALEFFYANSMINNNVLYKAHNPNYACLRRNPFKRFINLLRIDYIFSSLLNFNKRGPNFSRCVTGPMAKIGIEGIIGTKVFWSSYGPNVIQRRIMNALYLIPLLKRNLKIDCELGSHNCAFATWSWFVNDDYDNWAPFS